MNLFKSILGDENNTKNKCKIIIEKGVYLKLHKNTWPEDIKIKIPYKREILEYKDAKKLLVKLNKIVGDE